MENSHLHLMNLYAATSPMEHHGNMSHGDHAAMVKDFQVRFCMWCLYYPL